MEHYALDTDARGLQQVLDSMERAWPAGLPSRHLERFQPLTRGVSEA
jgi:hypothetical protein